MAFVAALMNSLITILLSYTSWSGRSVSGGGGGVRGGCVWHLLVLVSDKHTRTVMAHRLGLCQENWWHPDQMIDGFLQPAHTSHSVRLCFLSLSFCASICFPPPLYLLYAVFVFNLSECLLFCFFFVTLFCLSSRVSLGAFFCWSDWQHRNDAFPGVCACAAGFIKMSVWAYMQVWVFDNGNKQGNYGDGSIDASQSQ